MKRKIAAILAADVSGYSRLVAEDEEEALRRLASCRAAFEDSVASTGGRIFNTAGDSVLAEFQSAVEAVRCAVDVQESIRTRNLAYPPSRQMSFRIGITIGDVVEQNGDLLGEGVNIAARLEGLAPPGGIAVSRTVYEAVANKVSAGFSDMGLKALKNIPDPVHVYTIDTPATASGAMRRAAGARPFASPLVALATGLVGGAVLFYALGNGPDETAGKPTTDGGGRPPATQTARTETPPPAKAPEGASVSGVASEAPAAAPRPSTEASTTPSPEPSVATGAPAAAPTTGPDEIVAKHVLPRARQDCLADDPLAAADACRLVVEHGLATGAELAKAEVRLGRSLREAGKGDEAIAAYTKAIEIAPTAEAFTQRGVAHFDKEEWDAAIADYAKAIELDARHGEAFNNRAWLYYRLGDYDLAIKDADRAVLLVPGAAYAWDTRGHIRAARGDKTGAVSDLEQALKLDPASAGTREALERLGEKTY